MITRRLEKIIIETLQRTPSVALMGPRQIGKTTIALNITDTTPSIYLDLENPLDLEKVRDISAFHGANSNKLLVLDEIQRLPEIFGPLRGIIDSERRKGNKTNQFLFLGSASMQLLQQSGESLAGRISYLELYPVDVLEYAEADADELNMLWLRGGFPESLLAASAQDSLKWRRDFIRTYLERDIPQLGPRIPAQTLERFWTMLSYNQGTLLNASVLARSLDVSTTTVGRYLDLLSDLLLVRRLKPWTFNIGKRLVKSPKVYVRDSGITHALLNIANFNDLLGHPVAGGSWEGFVIENVMSVLPVAAECYYYRTPGGAELDLIIELSPTERWAVDIKRSSAPALSKGFYIACDDIKPTRKYVVYSGKESFPMGDGVIAIPIAGLMNELLKLQ